jgi:hypothetical protein
MPCTSPPLLESSYALAHLPDQFFRTPVHQVVDPDANRASPRLGGTPAVIPGQDRTPIHRSSRHRLRRDVPITVLYFLDALDHRRHAFVRILSRYLAADNRNPSPR